MKRILNILFLAFFITACFSPAAAQNEDTTLDIRSGITTLYAKDPIAKSFCFSDGKFGGTINRNVLYNRCSHIDYGNYNAESLTVGIQGGDRGIILDFGNADDLSKRYNYSETVGKGQGWSSIHYENGKLMILKNIQLKTFQPLTEADALFQNLNENSGRVLAKTGNIYLLRISDRSDKDFQLIVKLLILAHSPGEFVTFRWTVLDKN